MIWHKLNFNENPVFQIKFFMVSWIILKQKSKPVYLAKQSSF